MRSALWYPVVGREYFGKENVTRPTMLQDTRLLKRKRLYPLPRRRHTLRTTAVVQLLSFGCPQPLQLVPMKAVRRPPLPDIPVVSAAFLVFFRVQLPDVMPAEK